MKKAVLLITVILLLLLCSCGADVGKEAETTLIDASAAATSEKSDDIPFYTKEIKDDPSDPYADYAKEICGDIVDGWRGWNTNDFELYFKGKNYTYYSFYDLNGDGTDEMLLGEWVKVGDYTDDPNPPRELKLSAVCTVKEESVQCFGFEDLYAADFIYDRVILSNGLVMTTYGNEENPSCFFAVFDGKSLIMKDHIYHSMPDDTYGMKGNVKITEEEYHRRIDENIGDATPVEIEWKRIDEYGQ